jgi:2-keto-4-pentenoate hydratase/2-oxohepta-3-ene-1,7-dioic acid hydratase in catechol pathway
LLAGGTVYDLGEGTGEPADATVAALVRDWPSAEARIAALAARVAAGGVAGQPLATVALLAPLPDPDTIYGAGANYADHAAEMAVATQPKAERDDRSWHFIKSRHTVVGPGAEVAIPAENARTDWEVELAAIIGRKGRNIPVSEALSHVAGYTIAIDLSARGLSRRPRVPKESPFHVDWVSHKNFEGSCPMGPAIVPARDVPDPQNLAIGLSVNGIVKQQSTTANMIFSTAEQISHLSERLTLHPGDVILTGTPSGVGMGRGEFLKSGDLLVAWIEGLGELSVRMV